MEDGVRKFELVVQEVKRPPGASSLPVSSGSGKKGDKSSSSSSSSKPVYYVEATVKKTTLITGAVPTSSRSKPSPASPSSPSSSSSSSPISTRNSPQHLVFPFEADPTRKDMLTLTLCHGVLGAKRKSLNIIGTLTFPITGFADGQLHDKVFNLAAPKGGGKSGTRSGPGPDLRVQLLYSVVRFSSGVAKRGLLNRLESASGFSALVSGKIKTVTRWVVVKDAYCYILKADSNAPVAGLLLTGSSARALDGGKGATGGAFKESFVVETAKGEELIFAARDRDDRTAWMNAFGRAAALLSSTEIKAASPRGSVTGSQSSGSLAGSTSSSSLPPPRTGSVSAGMTRSPSSSSLTATAGGIPSPLSNKMIPRGSATSIPSAGSGSSRGSVGTSSSRRSTRGRSGSDNFVDVWQAKQASSGKAPAPPPHAPAHAHHHHHHHHGHHGAQQPPHNPHPGAVAHHPSAIPSDHLKPVSVSTTPPSTPPPKTASSVKAGTVPATPPETPPPPSGSRRDGSAGPVTGIVPAPPPVPAAPKRNSIKLSGIGSADPFDGAGEQAGLWVWRIIKMRPVRVAEEEHGHFYTESAYIVLTVSARWDDPTALKSTIHYWVGLKAKDEEAGCAALYAMNLEKRLGVSTLHREVEEHESAMFFSYFSAGVEYRSGGAVQGGLKSRGARYPTRLLHLKGIRNVRVRPVELLPQSLNAGDVFILDVGEKLYQWNGKESNKRERIKGLELMTKIKNNERSGRPDLVFLEQEETEVDPIKDPDVQDFWKALGGRAPVKGADEGGDDAEAEARDTQMATLYRIVRTEDGKLRVDRMDVEGKDLSRSVLKSDQSYLLECATEIFVWVGHESAMIERKAALRVAEELVGILQKPSWTPITRVIEDHEPVLFKEKFPSWIDKELTPADYDSIIPKNAIAGPSGGGPKSPGSPVDLEALRTAKRRKSIMPDAVESGGLDTLIMMPDTLQPVGPGEFGQFYSGHSYIVLHTWTERLKTAPTSPRSKETVTRGVLYFWEGAETSREKNYLEFKFGFSGLMEEFLATKGAKTPTQVRVVQNKEPGHFMALYHDMIIVHRGKTTDNHENKSRLYHVRTDWSEVTRAVEVIPAAKSLNSRDNFILVDPLSRTSWVWMGKGSSNQHRGLAEGLASILGPGLDEEIVEEGDEHLEFWAAIGGRGEYANAPVLWAGEPREPRLFHATNSSGTMRVVEFPKFSQDDLMDDDVMILDTWDEVFVWFGTQSNADERSAAFQIAMEYVRSDKNRPEDIPVTRVEAGHEPVMFTCNFIAWDDVKARKALEAPRDPYAERLAELRAAGQAAPVGKSR